MAKRPTIPTDVQQQLLFEVRHRCAVDCEPISLEKSPSGDTFLGNAGRKGGSFRRSQRKVAATTLSAQTHC
jgi:hypothetical protein